MTTRRCLIAVCTNWPYVPTPTARSLMEFGFGDRTTKAREAHGFSEIAFGWWQNFPRVDSMRDAAAEQAVADGFSHLLFLDADNVWPTDTLVRLLAHHDQGIVGGLYVQRGEPYAPVALVDGVQPQGSRVMRYQHDQGALEGTPGLRPVEVLGMGCTLIPTEVFAAIGPRPWFAYEDDDEGWPRVSEDVPFCRKVRAAGFGIWLDPTLECGHVTQMVTDARWARRYQDAQAKALAQMPFTIEAVGAHG